MQIDTAFLLDLLRIPSVTDDVPQVNRAVAAMRGWLEARGVFCETEAMPDDTVEKLMQVDGILRVRRIFERTKSEADPV